MTPARSRHARHTGRTKAAREASTGPRRSGEETVRSAGWRPAERCRVHDSGQSVDRIVTAGPLLYRFDSLSPMFCFVMPVR